MQMGTIIAYGFAILLFIVAFWAMLQQIFKYVFGIKGLYFTVVTQILFSVVVIVWLLNDIKNIHNAGELDGPTGIFYIVFVGYVTIFFFVAGVINLVTAWLSRSKSQLAVTSPNQAG